jgi:hypothetical protein
MPVDLANARAPAAAEDAGAAPVPGALPFTLAFRPAAYNPVSALPPVQSYACAAAHGNWLIVGGRLGQGLHKFNQTGQNFIEDDSNTFLWVIDPRAGTVASYALDPLPGPLKAALSATDQQAWYDRANDRMVVVGGYGYKADGSDMTTFDTLIAFTVADVMEAVIANAPAEKMAALFEVMHDPRLAVTGGALFNLDGVFVLAFGQSFYGQYRPFSSIVQQYTSNIALFTLNPRPPLAILSYSSLTSSDATAPYHRRDGNFIDDIDPATGRDRVAGLGGVFRPGIIGAYNDAVYIDRQGAVVDATLAQRFNAYTCPVISVWDAAAKATYHTFFGGISGTYYFQTPQQRAVFELVTKEGRNDGLPFVADISTLVHDASGRYTEWIHTSPTPDNLLVGASASFIPDDQLFAGGVFTANGHVRLDALTPGTPLRIGWIFGGILALNPLPLVPSTGTTAVNSVYEVWIDPRPMAAIPASAGKSAKPDYGN